MTLWSLLRRGLLVGALAGLTAGLFALVAAEPHVQAAINHEEAVSAQTEPAAATKPATAEPAADGHAHTHGDGEDVTVSRPLQRAGMVAATALSGMIFGGLLALAFGLRLTRRGPGRPWLVALAMGGTALYAFVLLPLAVYPANPPGIGNPDTINTRTLSYLVLVGGGLVAGWVASRAARAVARPEQPWRAWAAVLATLIAVAAVLALILPGAEAAPSSFPAQLLWEFRISALATQLVLWTALTLGFGAVVAKRLAVAGPGQAIAGA